MTYSDKKIYYDKFLKKSKGLFRYLHTTNKHNQELKKLYGFYVAPGGAIGGLDNRILQVFYANRPLYSYKTVGIHLSITSKLVIEHGACLQYLQIDNGDVSVGISPARTDNMGPIENEIIIGYIKNPKKLTKVYYLWKHWFLFIAYMNQTAIGGKKNFLTWFIYRYLKYFKLNIVDGKQQEIRILVWIKKILTFIISVGFSGWIVFFASEKLNKQTHKENSIMMEKTIEIIEQNNKYLKTIGEKDDFNIEKSIDEIIEKMDFQNAVLSDIAEGTITTNVNKEKAECSTK